MKRKGVVVVQGAYLGDLVLTLPLIHRLGETVDEPLGVVARADNAWLLKDVPAVDHVHSWDKSKGLGEVFRLATELRRATYRVAIVPHRTLKAAFMAAWAGIPHRVGFSGQAGQILHNRLVTYDKARHEVIRVESLGDALGLPVLEFDYGLIPDPAQVGGMEERLHKLGWQNELLMLIAPGSIWETKRWSAKGYAEVAGYYAEKGMLPVLVGIASDTLEVSGMLSERGVRFLDLGGKTELRELVALVAMSAGVIANDSATAHLGAALNVPTVAIFCSTSPDLGFAPFGQRASSVWSNIPCSPCGRTGKKKCPLGTLVCCDAVKPGQVIEVMGEVLRKVASHKHHD